MGIPSYFSYIIRNHANIIRNNYKMKNVVLHSLYMDCNSIIYDAIRGGDKSPNMDGSKALTEDQIIQTVIRKIDEYVRSIHPTNVLFIAFDGVAPLAKMNQQRNRRFKTGFLSRLDFSGEIVATKGPRVGQESTSDFNTALITPGTKFMEKLSSRINAEFIGREYLYGVNRLVISASDEEGEGEHKMFEYIRSNAQKGENIAVYGLDSDLIMLSLIHRFYCNNIFIFREAPEFSKSLIPKEHEIKPNELLFLDCDLLGLSILKEMGISLAHDEKTRANRICDYIFICFLLGNDFLPHFPALNIRTHGNYTLLDVYKAHIGKFNDRFLVSVDPIEVNWNWVKLYLSILSQNERQNIAKELAERDKTEAKLLGGGNRASLDEDGLQTSFENIPILYRGEEKYIRPNEMGWEERYYERAFGSNNTNAHVTTKSDRKNVCENYIEGLEWVYRYYVEGCCDWRWKYDGHYAPLLNDIISYIPDTPKSVIKPSKCNEPFHSKTQLLYVIPPWNHDEIFGVKNRTVNKIKDANPDFFQNKEAEGLDFQWMFCRYFWESHVKLPHIDVNTLNTWNQEFVQSLKRTGKA